MTPSLSNLSNRVVMKLIMTKRMKKKKVIVKDVRNVRDQQLLSIVANFVIPNFKEKDKLKLNQFSNRI